MKHHINIVIIALRVILFASGLMCVYNLVRAFGFIMDDNTKEIYDYFHIYFTPLTPSVTKSINALGNTYFPNIQWLAIGFPIAYTALIIYGMSGIVRLYKCLLKIEKGQIFYTEQGVQFRKVGGTIIIFAKIKYLLFCFTGIIVYFDVSTFAKQLPELLTLYLIGKLILIMSYMAEKGEFIKEENDLTV